MNKLSRKDIELLEMLAKTQDSKDALGEYIEQHNKAVKAYKAYRESVVNDVEVDKVVKPVEPVEMKRKFKAGDKVRVKDTESAIAKAGLRIGDIAEVFKYNSLLGDGMVELKTPGRTRFAYFGESSLELVEEKTPNELRAEIIEKAKEFVKEQRDDMIVVKADNPHGYVVGVSFIVNAGKRTAVALLRGVISDSVRAKGIAKCNPNDVFNEHIGKAIALGRALGKDVSEFENAPQPNELTVGMVIRRNYYESAATYEREIEKVEGEVLCYTRGGYDADIHSADNLTIINDTNARYKEQSNERQRNKHLG